MQGGCAYRGKQREQSSCASVGVHAEDISKRNEKKPVAGSQDRRRVTVALAMSVASSSSLSWSRSSLLRWHGDIIVIVTVVVVAAVIVVVEVAVVASSTRRAGWGGCVTDAGEVVIDASSMQKEGWWWSRCRHRRVEGGCSCVIDAGRRRRPNGGGRVVVTSSTQVEGWWCLRRHKSSSAGWWRSVAVDRVVVVALSVQGGLRGCRPSASGGSLTQVASHRHRCRPGVEGMSLTQVIAVVVQVVVVCPLHPLFSSTFPPPFTFRFEFLYTKNIPKVRKKAVQRHVWVKRI